MSLDWDGIVAHALSLAGTEAGSSYGQPAVKANGHTMISPGREAGSFCLHIDRDTVEMLKETDPETFWQTPHYEGWPSVLVRFDSPDPDRVYAMIERSRDWCLTRPKARPRKKG
ncbi:MmcQ/YjbR family DNA-binding protein [Flavisphingomonas formosensis]|uniref:MmcQ/YjbR family DNA-binding protein n=1 Tax=Flavisphingomonas formosensis TaxID=861534 RepID=UPI0012F8AC92|nr:MmcQ/YjbR family DNA-binding protein [Sphingomonas formosensis]